MEIIEKSVLSSDKVHILKGKVYLPECEPKGIFQVVHGMTEHIGRYDAFMQKMAESGYICFGYDHLGHGHTAENDGELGFIAHKNGWERLCEDVGVFADNVRKEYGEALPYYLLGHSMGSFIVRLSSIKYTKPDKLIIMGTGGPNPAAGVGILAAKLIKALKGERHVSPFLESLAFGTYNNKFKSENDSKAWLTKDVKVREKYKAEKLCMFHFTVSAMQDLITLNKNCNVPQWFKSAAVVCPILLVSGDLDPVGNNSKGVIAVFEALKKQGADVTMHLYKNCRHEILNDDCRDMCFADILSFISR